MKRAIEGERRGKGERRRSSRERRGGGAGTAEVDGADARALLARGGADVLCVAEAELAVGVAAPAGDVAPFEQRARVAAARGHRLRPPPCRRRRGAGAARLSAPLFAYLE